MTKSAIPGVLGQSHAFTPSHLEKKKPKPVYWLRSGSFVERTQYLAEVEEFSGPEVYQFQKDDAFRDSLAICLPDRDDQPDNADHRARYLDILASARSGQDISAEDVADFENIWRELARLPTALKKLEAQAALRDNLLPGLALKHYCVKLDNIMDRFGKAITFEADDNGHLSDNILLRLETMELAAAGTFAHNLQFGLSAEKNSGLPSPSEGDSAALTETTEDPGDSPPEKSATVTN
jgi:hypothetical protein